MEHMESPAMHHLPAPRRVLLRVAYDGTNYHGWQQQEGARTIEGVLTETLNGLCGEPVTLTGASRTDAGVHARGNVAVFDTTSHIPADKLPRALNGRLPQDIRVTSGMEVAADFHPRHCVSYKTYEYRILNTPTEDPLRSRYATWYYGALDAPAMHAAAQALSGTHDFTSFCSTHAQSETRVRTIYDIAVYREDAPDSAGGEIVIRVRGDGFLYNMVRIIAGTLIDVGRGHTPPQRLSDILSAHDRAMAGPTAPPQGLTLMEICYPRALPITAAPPLG